MALPSGPQPFTREFDRLFDAFFGGERAVAALGPADGPRRGRRPLRAEGRPARCGRGGRVDRGAGRDAHHRRRAQRRGARRAPARVVPLRAHVRLASAARCRFPRASTTTGSRRVRPRRARGADPQARGAQARAKVEIKAGRGQRQAGRRSRARRRRRRPGEAAHLAWRECAGLHHRRPRRVRPRGRPSYRATARSGRRPSCRWRRTATVKTLQSAEVADARLRHGARQHLPPVHPAGARADRRARRAARVHGLGPARSSPTPAATRCSRWATARWPRRSSAGAASAKSMIVAIEEEGVRFRSYLAGEERFMGPETSMEVQAALGSDIALAFDECTPFHVDRDYTASSMAAHPPLARPLPRLARRARTARTSSCSGSSRAGCTRTCAPSRPPT